MDFPYEYKIHPNTSSPKIDPNNNFCRALNGFLLEARLVCPPA